MKRMKLFPKTFLYCLGLIIGVILIAFFLIYSLLPVFYRAYKQRELNADTQQLVAELQAVSLQNLSDVISSYALSKGYGYTASYENGDIICSAGAGMSFQMVGSDFEEEEDVINFEFDLAESERIFTTGDGETVCLTLNVSLQPIGDAVSVLLLILPVVLVFCILFSALVSYFYAKAIVKPIQSITAATTEMQSLMPGVLCAVNRNDEIGVLSQNINEMYQKLLSTISDLEQEIQTVSEAEQEKLDFLLLASHELKTPVTAVRGMVDGMLYHVGVYKDRDTYLKECQKVLENLTELLCRILETSKLDADTAAKSKAEIDVGVFLEEMASPYFMIARNRNIAMTLSKENDFSAVISVELIRKVLSNVLSNAVKYTDPGKMIRLYLEKRTVVVENECEPLSAEELAHIGEPFYRPAERKKENDDSTGLGLYFTDRILSACQMTYSFAPYENGMRFVLNF